jgi:PAS domain S-box-containing protein
MTKEHHHTQAELIAELEWLRERNTELEALIRHDTAEHEITAPALHESEVRHRTYIENAPLAIFVADSSRRFVDLNEAACRMTGYSRSELLEMLTGQVVERVGPADSGPAFESLQKTGNLQAERTIRRKDGSTCAVLLNAVALPADRFMAFCTDITERKADERERFALEARKPGDPGGRDRPRFQQPAYGRAWKCRHRESDACLLGQRTIRH